MLSYRPSFLYIDISYLFSVSCFLPCHPYRPYSQVLAAYEPMHVVIDATNPLSGIMRVFFADRAHLLKVADFLREAKIANLQKHLQQTPDCQHPFCAAKRAKLGGVVAKAAHIKTRRKSSILKQWRKDGERANMVTSEDGTGPPSPRPKSPRAAGTSGTSAGGAGTNTSVSASSPSPLLLSVGNPPLGPSHTSPSPPPNTNKRGDGAVGGGAAEGREDGDLSAPHSPQRTGTPLSTSADDEGVGLDALLQQEEEELEALRGEARRSGARNDQPGGTGNTPRSAFQSPSSLPTAASDSPLALSHGSREGDSQSKSTSTSKSTLTPVVPPRDLPPQAIVSMWGVTGIHHDADLSSFLRGHGEHRLGLATETQHVLGIDHRYNGKSGGKRQTDWGTYSVFSKHTRTIESIMHERLDQTCEYTYDSSLHFTHTTSLVFFHSDCRHAMEVLAKCDPRFATADRAGIIRVYVCHFTFRRK